MKGRGKWHRDKWHENHEKLKKRLLQAKTSTTISKLYRETGLSRRRISKHLEFFISEGDVIRDGKRFLWKINRPLNDILKSLEKTVSELKNPKKRKNFRSALMEKISVSKDSSDTIKSIESMSLPFHDLLTQLVSLQLYLHSTSLFKDPFAEEPEHLVSTNYFIFGPNMALLTWWVPGTWPQIEDELKPDNLVKRATLKKPFETKG